MHQTGCIRLSHFSRLSVDVLWKRKRELQVVSIRAVLFCEKSKAVSNNTVLGLRLHLHTPNSKTNLQNRNQFHMVNSTKASLYRKVTLCYVVLCLVCSVFSDGFLCSFFFRGFSYVLFMLFFLCRPSWTVIYLEAKGWSTSLLLGKLSPESLGT